MTTNQLEKIKYPIGKFNCPSSINKEDISIWGKELESFPTILENTVSSLIDFQLDTSYRPNGWTVRQLVHHLADSHNHAYTRFKWALTEDKPIVKEYNQDTWALLDDAKKGSIKLSLLQLKAVHAKWVSLLKQLKSSELNRSYILSNAATEYTLKECLGMYVWHGKHHLAQIENVLLQKGWR